MSQLKDKHMSKNVETGLALFEVGGLADPIVEQLTKVFATTDVKSKGNVVGAQWKPKTSKEMAVALSLTGKANKDKLAVAKRDAQDHAFAQVKGKIAAMDPARFTLGSYAVRVLADGTPAINVRILKQERPDSVDAIKAKLEKLTGRKVELGAEINNVPIEAEVTVIDTQPAQLGAIEPDGQPDEKPAELTPDEAAQAELEREEADRRLAAQMP